MIEVILNNPAQKKLIRPVAFRPHLSMGMAFLGVYFIKYNQKIMNVNTAEVKNSLFISRRDARLVSFCVFVSLN